MNNELFMNALVLACLIGSTICGLIVKNKLNKIEAKNEKWHDLRIDPNDLPRHADQVVVAYEPHDYDIGEYWAGDEGWGNTPLPVIAWKYIKHLDWSDEMTLVNDPNGLELMEQCLRDTNKPCNHYACCEAQNVKCCAGCKYKCESRCERSKK